MTTQPHQAAERNEMDATRYPSMEAKRADVEKCRIAHKQTTEKVDEAKRAHHKAGETLVEARDEERKAWRAYWQALEAEVLP